MDQRSTPRLAGCWYSVLWVLCVSCDSDICTAEPALRLSLVQRKSNDSYNTSVFDVCRVLGDSNGATGMGTRRWRLRGRRDRCLLCPSPGTAGLLRAQHNCLAGTQPSRTTLVKETG